MAATLARISPFVESLRPHAAGPRAPRLTPPASRQEEKSSSRERFGPRGAPLFYTGLHQTPARLAWEPVAEALAYRVSLRALESGCPMEAPVWSATVMQTARSCSLADWNATPGRHYLWRVEPVFAEARMEGERAATGCFWLMDAAARARWERFRAVTDEVAEADFRAIAQALLLAEVGLYYDAVRAIQAGPMQSEREARRALTHTALALVYRQMGQRLARAETLSETCPETRDSFAAWAAARAEHYRQKALA